MNRTSPPPRLQVVIASTRPGRLGPAVGRWVRGLAAADGGFEVELVDLADFDLPVFDEPAHPRHGRYEHDHTRRWSAKVAEADAFVFVTPEYNYGPTPALVNALTYLHREWAYKPAAFVSYGGGSGGLRGVQAAKLAMVNLRMAPIVEAVSISGIADKVEDGVFAAGERQADAARKMLAELRRWAEALRPLRS